LRGIKTDKSITSTVFSFIREKCDPVDVHVADTPYTAGSVFLVRSYTKPGTRAREFHIETESAGTARVLPGLFPLRKPAYAPIRVKNYKSTLNNTLREMYATATSMSPGRRFEGDFPQIGGNANQ
jgi:hypothetical protein